MKKEICLFSQQGRAIGRSDLQTEKRQNRGQDARLLKERQAERKMFHCLLQEINERGRKDEKREIMKEKIPNVSQKGIRDQKCRIRRSVSGQEEKAKGGHEGNNQEEEIHFLSKRGGEK